MVEVLDEGDSGLLSLGRRPAKVRVTADDEPSFALNDEFPATPETPETSDEVYYGDDETYAGDPETPEEAETVSYVANILAGIGIHGQISSFRKKTRCNRCQRRDCGARSAVAARRWNIQYLASLVANKHSKIIFGLSSISWLPPAPRRLISLAERTAARVSGSGQKISLEPMNPAERRIIHSALQGYPGVTTYSEGEDAERHIVIAPLSES